MGVAEAEAVGGAPLPVADEARERAATQLLLDHRVGYIAGAGEVIDEDDAGALVDQAGQRQGAVGEEKRRGRPACSARVVGPARGDAAQAVRRAR